MPCLDLRMSLWENAGTKGKGEINSMSKLHQMKEGTTPQLDEQKSMEIDRVPDLPDRTSNSSMISGGPYPEQSFDFVKLPLPDRMRRIPDEW